MNNLKGYFMITGAAMLWGISATAAKLLLNQQIDTLLIVQSRVTFSCLLMVLFFLLFTPRTLRVNVHDLWRFALLGIFGVAGANFTYYFAIKESTVATAILIQYTAPLAVMGYAAITREEELTLAKSIAAAVSFLGCFLAVGAYDPSVLEITPIGLLSAIGSMITFAFLNVYTRHLLKRHNLWTITFYSIAFASLFWLTINPPGALVAERVSGETWWALVLLAIISVLIPHSLFFAGLQHVVPTRAIITSTLEPVVAILSAAIVLDEYLRAPQIIGAVVVISAIVLLQVRREPGEVRRSSTIASGHQDAEQGSGNV